MATGSYEEALRQVRLLSLSDRARLLAEISNPPDGKFTQTSILQLQGLGKDIWRGLDIEEYLRQERSSWNG